MGPATFMVVQVEPCRHYTQVQHQLALPGCAEPIRYLRPYCQMTDSYRGPDSRLAEDPDGNGAPDGGRPCANGRTCYSEDRSPTF